jgi:hypothetical protein
MVKMPVANPLHNAATAVPTNAMATVASTKEKPAAKARTARLRIARLMFNFTSLALRCPQWTLG